MTNSEHKHEWLVVTSVNTLPWNLFARFRGPVEELEKIELKMAVTHTLICNECLEIKKIES